MIDRRSFIGTLAGGLIAGPLAAEAQQTAKIPRIGYLSPNEAATPYTREAFRQGLRDLGYVEGRSVMIEYRDADGKPERFRALAAELVALKVDVIVAQPPSPPGPPSKRPGPSRLFSLLLAIRLRTDSSPAWRGRVAISRGWQT